MSRPAAALSLVLALAGCACGLSAGEDAATLFAKRIQPLLADRCVSCHGAEKAKGKLRLDSVAGIRAGGAKGPVVVAGAPERSSLYRLVQLPPGDDDIMPAKGEPLSEQQRSWIRDWIAGGAPMPDAGAAGSLSGTAAAMIPPAGTVHAAPFVAPPTDLDALAADAPVPDSAAVAAMAKLGAVAQPLSANGRLLDLSLCHITGGIEDQLSHLRRLSPNIAWLDLAGTTITDRQLGELAAMPRLVRLRLDRTGIGDPGVAALAKHPRLAHLNLVGSRTGDASAATLAALPGLTAVFLWNTAMTAEAIGRLRSQRPGLAIDAGDGPMPKPADMTAGGRGRGAAKAK